MSMFFIFVKFYNVNEATQVLAAIATSKSDAAAAAPFPGSTHDNVLEVGCRVHIHSLQSKPELNGVEGIVSAEVREKGG